VAAAVGERERAREREREAGSAGREEFGGRAITDAAVSQEAPQATPAPEQKSQARRR